MADGSSSEEKHQEAAAAPERPPSSSTRPPSAHNASSYEDQEKAAEHEQIRVADSIADDDDAARRNNLDRMKSAATVTSVSSTLATGMLPEDKPWYKQPNPLRWGGTPPVPTEKTVSPEHKAGFLSALVFQWISPLMTRGYKRPLEFNDIYSINPDRAVDPLTDKMRAAFRRRVDAGEKFPLLWAINETFFWEFWLGGCCSLLSSIMQVMSPFTLRYLIQFAADAYVASLQGLPAPHIGRGVGLVIGVTAMQIIQSLATNHFIYRGMVVGGMVRASLISVIYEKSLVISGRAKAGGADLPDIPAARAAEKKNQEDAAKRGGKNKKGPGGQPGVSGDGVGWGNGRIVSKQQEELQQESVAPPKLTDFASRWPS